MTDPTPPSDHSVPRDPILDTGAPTRGPEPRSTRRPVRRILGIVAAVLVVGAVVAGLTIRLPEYILSPGMSRPTEPAISVEGATTYDTAGAVDFLTVSMRQATPLELLAAKLNPDLDVRSREEMFGTQTDAENRSENLQMMADSKDSAEYQALTRLGYDVTSHGTGAVVTSVAEGSPAWCDLRVGEVVTSIDSTPVHLNSELVSTIGAMPPGTTVTLTVEPFSSTSDHTTVDPPKRDGCPPDAPVFTAVTGPQAVAVTLGARPDDASRAYMGISTFTRDLSFDFPVQVTIDSGSVGGPSAGLAFTLGILDVLTPGSLTGGLKVATTGTMSLDGKVGPIGGIHQKVIAARRKGVELMLVPSSEIDEARHFAGDLRIEPVDTLDEALAVLATVGGGDLVLPPKRA